MCNICEIWPTYEDGSKIEVGDCVCICREGEKINPTVTSICFIKDTFNRYLVDIHFYYKGHWHTVYKCYEDQHFFHEAYASSFALHNFQRPST